MKILAVHHNAIICSNYAQSKDFYVNLLGCTVIHEAYRESRKSYKLDLKLPGDTATQIELFSFPNPPKRPTEPEACGLRHLAFAVNNVQETAAELENKGIAVEPLRKDAYTGKLFTFFQDPDGLPLELYEG
ncbi:MAG: VOC family protein [Sporolactobacillus sp.]